MSETEIATVHGSPDGYARGCRSRGGCPHHQHPTLLTCVEAAVAARGDRHLAQLPATQPLARWSARADVPAAVTSGGQTPAGEAHGTVWRYRQGCTEARTCPHWKTGRLTCADARRRYFAEYHARRRDGRGSPIDHGTSAGYLSGCTSQDECPRNDHGASCHEARADYRRRRARAQGIGPVDVVIDAEATRIVHELAKDMSIRTIAAASGVGRTTIGRLLAADPAGGVQPVIKRETLTALRSTSQTLRAV